MIKDEWGPNPYLKYKDLNKQDIEKAVSELLYGKQRDKPLNIMFLTKEAEDTFRQQIIETYERNK